MSVDRVWAGSEIRLGTPIPSSTLTSWSGPSLGVWGTDFTVWAQLPRIPLSATAYPFPRQHPIMHTKVIDFQEISKPSFLAFLGLHVHPFLGCRLSCPLEGLISIHYPQGSENLFYSLLFFPFPLSAPSRLDGGNSPKFLSDFPFFPTLLKPPGGFVFTFQN